MPSTNTDGTWKPRASLRQGPLSTGYFVLLHSGPLGNHWLRCRLPGRVCHSRGSEQVANYLWWARDSHQSLSLESYPEHQQRQRQPQQQQQQQQQQKCKPQYGLCLQQPGAQHLDVTKGATPLWLPDRQQVLFSGPSTEQFAPQVRPLSPAVVCVGQAAVLLKITRALLPVRQRSHSTCCPLHTSVQHVCTVGSSITGLRMHVWPLPASDAQWCCQALLMPKCTSFQPFRFDPRLPKHPPPPPPPKFKTHTHPTNLRMHQTTWVMG